ncbi:DUF551 domain-containing protein [Citrobacter portucalensis]|uniref:DUF551 domain-containing protein n=1 Tax=Citrobacter portucalensis TaxID=1639133 RepID=UPI00226B719F|nr:DUF551 domain-containing protein [Citrobacter portucalensis]MCX8976529.1 DUF551 domain-containing protein [Citrobacter portucalensis]
MTNNNHQAHGPVSLERLHQIREILSKAAAQSDGGNLGYAMADAVKVIDEVLTLRNGEQKPAHEYTDLQVDEAVARMEDEGDMVLVPRGVLGAASGAIRHPGHEAGVTLSLLRHYSFRKQPAPVVPDELTREEYRRRFMEEDNFDDTFRGGWSACRAAMLQGAEPVSNRDELPDGWVACSERMPEGMTDVHISNGHDVGQGWWDGDTWQTQHDYYSVPGDVTHWMPLPAAPQQEVKP